MSGTRLVAAAGSLDTAVVGRRGLLTSGLCMLPTRRAFRGVAGGIIEPSAPGPRSALPRSPDAVQAVLGDKRLFTFSYASLALAPVMTSTTFTVVWAGWPDYDVVVRQFMTLSTLASSVNESVRRLASKHIDCVSYQLQMNRVAAKSVSTQVIKVKHFALCVASGLRAKLSFVEPPISIVEAPINVELWSRFLVFAWCTRPFQAAGSMSPMVIPLVDELDFAEESDDRIEPHLGAGKTFGLHPRSYLLLIFTRIVVIASFLHRCVWEVGVVKPPFSKHVFADP